MNTKEQNTKPTLNSPCKQHTLLLLGDLMLGRLVDQLLPTHVDEPSESRLISSMIKSNPSLTSYTHLSPWGNSLPLLRSSDLVLGNLETSVTTHPHKWPNKVFNYRMHPDNIKCLTEAGVDYVSLANNHTLDFCEAGLTETVKALKKAGIKFAGAGETEDEAKTPAVLYLPDSSREEGEHHEIHVSSISDHPASWSEVRQFNLLPSYSSSAMSSLKRQLRPSSSPFLKILSIHWGPNYAWRPDASIRDLAHFLIDECGVDIIHGHSSHHIQGVEIYRGKPVIYGCGDFIDDYAVTREYRSDLSAAWRVTVESEVDDTNVEKKETSKLVKIEMFPNRIQRFQACLLDPGDPDHEWVRNKFRELSSELGTVVEDYLGEKGQVIVDLTKQRR